MFGASKRAASAAHHFPEADSKLRLLKLIDSCRPQFGLGKALELTRISKSRYLRWKDRERNCRLKDYSRCPRKFPHQLTGEEIAVMKKLFFDKSLSHYSTPSLCYYAQRTGQLFCSPQSWNKYSRQLGWTRPGKRIYPQSKRIGIQAKKPDQIWHMDLSVYRLPNNKKMYIQAIIDNYSKYIIGWHISHHKKSVASARLLRSSLKTAKTRRKPILFVDDGSENQNRPMDLVLEENDIQKVIAQIDVAFSNSRIEIFFRTLKNNYLYKKNVRTPEDLKRYLDFYINEYNNHIPQLRFNGGTPEQMYNGTWGPQNIDRLHSQILEARRRRTRRNQQMRCSVLAVS